MRPAPGFKKSEKIVHPSGTNLEGVALSWRPAIPIPPSPPCLAGHPLGVVELSATPIFFVPAARNSPHPYLFETKPVLIPTSFVCMKACQRATACALCAQAGDRAFQEELSGYSARALLGVALKEER